ncbi:0fd24a5c-df01-40a9-8c3e-a138a5a3fed6 [Sclerotinia trifoliorum]|uniref:0fd24a5c-df01-40a9-8c3e-a138a5a3fed6 n=1 Tax=Sclerotinia trifoliorum TaxID=28548 RepID=A0A8H2ZTP9_9HELO|nr:0fd24a5c-df01-40a9-8c3e-a138a5a3fed6 [Sclerotinia trifoliorum]
MDNMIFCTYCGKSFTRKEHLERHIPSHTNVKPHRCTLCQLSFPRRDLLQRHHSTYHEAKDPMEPLPGGVPTVNGRTPIACINCASAKTGCDKRVPCSRCAEKNLPCASRYARRSSKAANRASSSHKKTPQIQEPPHDPMDQDTAPKETLTEAKISPTDTPVDPQFTGVAPGKTEYSVQDLKFTVDGFGPSPGETLGGMEHSMFGNTDTISGNINYQDLMTWSHYPLDLDMYSMGSELSGSLVTAGFLESSETSSNSDPIFSGSLHPSPAMSHTKSASISSQSDANRQAKMIDIAVPILTDNSVVDFELLVAAESAWPLARCNPRLIPGPSTRTAIAYLENLEQHSKHDATWDSLDHDVEPVELQYGNGISVMPVSASTRDRIIAITQSFLHTALETHRGGLKCWPKSSNYTSPDGGFNFLVLPPSNVLEYFLRSHVRSLAPYYTLINGGNLDPNELMLNNQTSTLLLLLMIAHGASALPTAEARCLTAGLTEACRISLFKVIEKNVDLSADPVVFKCALLFTILGAWGGDASHMNLAMAQRGMYLAMLKHAGMLEPQIPVNPSFHEALNPHEQWTVWLQREKKSRLVYNWVMVDQELSLFHDTAPIMSITELETPMPGLECLWLAKDANEWSTIIQQTYIGTDWLLHSNPVGTPPAGPSLCGLFRDMLSDNIERRHGQLSPLQLKLLLHPLHSSLCHLHQALSFQSEVYSSRQGTRTVTKASNLLRLQEAQSLLQKWYDLCELNAKNDPNCQITRANLVLYHLISLNAVTLFPDIERLARKEDFDGTSFELSQRYKRCIYNPAEALFHCGQVIRLVTSMPKEGRPRWWSVAIYRVTMILWLECVARVETYTQRLDKGPIFPIDAVAPDHPSVKSYLWNAEGTPVLSKADGYVELNRPNDVMNHCISLLDFGVTLPMPDGIRRKLVALSSNWNMEIKLQNT